MVFCPFVSPGLVRGATIMLSQACLTSGGLSEDPMTRTATAIADVTFVLLALALAGRLVWCVVSLATAPGMMLFLFGVPAGFFAADVASGLAHWLCDTYFQPATPLIGPTIITPFREHHVDPAAIGRHGMFERNGNNCLAALPLLAVGAFWPWDLARAGHALAIGVLAAASLTLCFTNQIHAWAHTSSVPRVVRWLQHCGILLAPERHARHHDGVHNCAYAVVSGWSNRWLDRALIRMEALLTNVGVRPRAERAMP